ncbi:MAG: diadenylate cyclase, partial [Acidobacteriota bacterium]
GPVAPGFDLRVADDGEIQVAGETVMRGYWGHPEASRRVTTDDGWLRTRDYGELDEDGHLHLTGRAGETLLLSTGRRVDPCHVERLLEDSPLIHRAAAFGEGRSYVAVLIVPDLDAIAQRWRDEVVDSDAAAGDELPIFKQRSSGSSDVPWWWNVLGEGDVVTTTADPRVQAWIDEVVDAANRRLDDWERIERYGFVGQPRSVEAERLIEARVHDRAELFQLFADEIQSMYPRGLRPTDREITQVQVGPERLRELLEKEAILDAWTSDAGVGFLLELAREHGIDAPSVIHICDAAANVAQMENEEKPLSTALIVGDPLRIHRVVPTSLIQLHRHEHIRRMRSRLVDLSKLVDGLVLAYIVDRHGYVRGIGRLDIDLEDAPTALFGPQFRRHAEISRRCDAVVFFVPKGGRQVRVFSRGQLVGRYSNGDWSPENASLLAGTADELTAGRNVDAALVGRLLRCAFRMSEENQGAIFMVGDAERILAKSDRPDLSRFAWISSSPMDSLTDDELINFAQQDGATVIDAESARFRSCMVLLRPDAATRADIAEGKGARHSSAAKMSAETESLAITVSQDGPITVFDHGQRILSL